MSGVRSLVVGDEPKHAPLAVINAVRASSRPRRVRRALTHPPAGESLTPGWHSRRSRGNTSSVRRGATVGWSGACGSSRCSMWSGFAHGPALNTSLQCCWNVIRGRTDWSSAAPRGPRGRPDLGDPGNLVCRCYRLGSRVLVSAPRSGPQHHQAVGASSLQEATSPRRDGSRSVPRLPPDTRCPARSSVWRHNEAHVVDVSGAIVTTARGRSAQGILPRTAGWTSPRGIMKSDSAGAHGRHSGKAFSCPSLILPMVQPSRLTDC